MLEVLLVQEAILPYDATKQLHKEIKLSKKGYDIKILFTSSKSLKPPSREVPLDKYKISSIPTARESLSDTHENLLLEFYDLWKDDQRTSNPTKEGDYILSLLSLILQMKVEFDSLKVNNAQVTLRRRRSTFLMGKMEFPSDLEDLFKKLHSLDLDVLRQYLRSCSAYRIALSLIDNSPTLSFFLLVTAIEAISNTVIRGGTRSEKFRKFILRYLPSSFEDELGDRKLLQLLMKQAYKMRSAFTHGGTEISIATLSADDLARKYVKHYVKGKEVYSPSLRWFESVVRAVLLEFLRSRKVIEGKESPLSVLAIEEQAIYLKAKKSLRLGQLITTKDIDLDFQNER